MIINPARSFIRNEFSKPSNIIQVNDPIQGRYYLVDGIHKYKSVTTALSELSNEDLDQWKNNVGKDAAELIARKAASRGTHFHEDVEKYLNNIHLEYLNNQLIRYQSFLKVVDTLDRINNIRLQESPLYSHIFKLAGTIDLLADFDNEISIIDFKTSSKPKSIYEIENYFIQTSLYSYMVEELYGLKVNKLVIIMSVGVGKPLIFEEERKNWKTKCKQMIQKNKQ